MVLRLRGAGPIESRIEAEMSIAAGGLIEQVIHRDTHRSNWDTAKTTVFNAQILNSASYQAVTGSAPPTMPIPHEIYTAHGFPYYKMYEEPSGVHGDFDQVKSVGQIKGKVGSKVTVRAPQIVDIGYHHQVVNPQGPLQELRSVTEFEAVLEGYHVAEF
jgi:hypothetical protein